jgi:hypothetical protein
LIVAGAAIVGIAGQVDAEAIALGLAGAAANSIDTGLAARALNTAIAAIVHVGIFVGAKVIGIRAAE